LIVIALTQFSVFLKVPRIIAAFITTGEVCFLLLGPCRYTMNCFESDLGEYRSCRADRIKEKGFTLVELMVTLAVITIVLTVGIPSFSSLAASNRATSEANALVAALNLARSESIKRGVQVSVCSAKNPLPAMNGCGDASDWTNGWLVFTDQATAGTVDGGDQVLRAFEPLGSKSNFNAGANAFVRYVQSGKKDGGPVAFDMYQTGCMGNQKRIINISATGRVNVTRGACP
jgi:type IV fimbrial biogenesis protein FimT